MYYFGQYKGGRYKSTIKNEIRRRRLGEGNVNPEMLEYLGRELTNKFG